MFRSTDGGGSWENLGLEKCGQIGRIIVHPDNPDEVWVGALGSVFKNNVERGVYHSTDGGENWKQVLYISDKTGCIDLAINPENPRILYAGMWTFQRKPWTTIDGSEEGGVWQSTDGGLNWKRLEAGLPMGVQGRIGLAVAPSNPQRVYVIVETEKETEGGVYRTDNGGKSFTKINREHKLRQRAWYYNRIEVDPQNENTVYVMNVGFHKSIDGGKNWNNISVPHGDNHALWINPFNSDIMIEGNDGGACITLNGGETWSSQNNQPTSEFYRVSVDNQFPYRIYGAQQDNSTISIPSYGAEDLTSTSSWKAVGGGESGHIAVDPRDPDVVYAGTYIGTITRKDFSTGYQANINAYPQMHDGQAFRDIKYRFQWNAPIRISPHNPDIVYHASQFVHQTKDGGKTWKEISPDLTTDKDAYHDIPGGPVQHDHTGVELYTTIFALEESMHNPGELWAGTDDGRLHVRRGASSDWDEVTPDGLPKEATINSIEISSHDENVVFISAFKYREGDSKPYIFKTTDGGRKWNQISNGIHDNHFVRVVRQDPVHPEILYAGTEFGLYISLNQGMKWEPLQLNLPVTPITDMVLHQGDMIVATQGRSFWVLDDLRQLGDVLSSEGVSLSVPSTTTRYQARRSSSIKGKSYGTRVVVNLPDLEKYEEIELRVIDPFGTERLKYSSDESTDKGHKKIKWKEGLNIIQWDLKYEGLETNKGSFFSLANTGGIKAPTGMHKLELRLDDEVVTADLEIVKDPRWSQTDEDLMDQYVFSSEIKSLFNTCHDAVRELRSIRDQVGFYTSQDKISPIHPSYKSMSDSLLLGLKEVEEKLIQTRNEAGQDPINYPSKIDDQIAYLYSVVNGADDQPSIGARKRFADLDNELNVILDEYAVVKTSYLDRLREIIKKSGKVIWTEIDKL